MHDGVGEGGFVFLHREDLLLHRIGGDEAIGDHGLGLADAVRAVDRLRFDGGIPPRVAEDDVARGGEVEAGAGGLEREQEHGLGFVGLELVDEFAAVLRGAGQHEITDSGFLEPWFDELQQ